MIEGKEEAAEKEETEESWLNGILGNKDDKAADGVGISVIDLSLVPKEILQIVVSMIAGRVLKHLQELHKENEVNKTSGNDKKYEKISVVLVLEEAHRFIGKNAEDSLCRDRIEKVAREGRKFGLGLVVSSQRPSELSPTVLSQCNTYLLHCLKNEEDQKIVKSLVPESYGKLMSNLSVLPQQQAMLLGWAAELPILMKVKDLKEGQQPTSEDALFNFSSEK